MALLRLDADAYSCGRATFHDGLPSEAGASARIYVRIAVEGIAEPFLALLDTGAEWSVLTKEIADEIGLVDADGEETTLSHRRGTTRGKLVRTTVTMLADEGAALDIEATVFVPIEPWP